MGEADQMAYLSKLVPVRAATIARMQAELINGGSSQYSPANCMNQVGSETCKISNTADGFRFRFLGGGAGWAARREPATIETIILISPDDKLSKIEYNGPVRKSATADAAQIGQPNHRWRGSWRQRCNRC